MKTKIEKIKSKRTLHCDLMARFSESGHTGTIKTKIRTSDKNLTEIFCGLQSTLETIVHIVHPSAVK